MLSAGLPEFALGSSVLSRSSCWDGPRGLCVLVVPAAPVVSAGHLQAAWGV